MWLKHFFCFVMLVLLSACAPSKIASVESTSAIKTMPNGLPPIDLNSAIYELPVKDGVSYQDVIDSLKSISEGMNFVNPANFPIAEHMKLRGIDPQGGWLNEDSHA